MLHLVRDGFAQTPFTLIRQMLDVWKREARVLARISREKFQIKVCSFNFYFSARLNWQDYAVVGFFNLKSQT